MYQLYTLRKGGGGPPVIYDAVLEIADTVGTGLEKAHSLFGRAC